MPKIWLHREGAEHCCSQKVAVSSSKENADAVVAAFVAYYNAQLGGATAVQRLDEACVELRHEDGRAVQFESTDCPRDREDIFVVDCPRKVLKKAAPSSSSSISSTASTITTASANNSVTDVVKKVRGLLSSKSYADARRQCEAAMKVSKDAALPLLMTEILLATEKFDGAAEYGELACEGSMSSSSKKKATYLLALAYFRCGQINEAWQNLRALDTSTSSSSRVAGSEAQNLDLDIIALQSECLFAAGRHSDAANLINGHMSDAGAEIHMSILLAYSGFALQYGKIPEALRAMLKAVTIDQRNKKARKILTDILVKDGGFEELIEQLPPSEKSAAAYAFLATIAKDHSAIPLCIALLSLALQYRPDSASYALNLVHAIEVQNDYDGAINAARSFLSANQVVSVSGGVGAFTCGALLDALDGGKASVEDADCVGWAVRWVDDGKRGYSTTHAIVARDGSATVVAADEEAWTGAEKATLDENALDVLAIGFTLIKLLYLQGRLAALPALYRVLEPTRHRSKQALHETSIRNEHAYYQCIAQVLAYRLDSLYTSDPTLACCDAMSHPAFAEARQNPLYAVGDSHCLSCAWSVLTVGGKKRLVLPKLVTGVKHWHLRPESDFYPKFNFKTTLSSIPDQSDVMFIIGEIDCREGILLAVERDKYPSVHEGMRSTIAIFSKVLSGLVATKKINAFVHPVLPMLKETRALVLAYNKLYQEATLKLASSNKKIKWLDFFSELVSAGPGSSGSAADVELKSGLVLDGTHISPCYVSMIQAAM